MNGQENTGNPMSEDLKQKILEESQSKRPETEIVGDDLLYKRSEEDYEVIWNAFLKEAEDFESKMGYGKEKIEKIGTRKFIDAMDWRNPEDVTKWRTDMMHVYYCVHREDNFVIFEETPICKACKEKYDLEKMEQIVSSENGYMMNMIIAISSDFRSLFLKSRETPVSEIARVLKQITEQMIEETVEKVGEANASDY